MIEHERHRVVGFLQRMNERCARGLGFGKGQVFLLRMCMWDKGSDDMVVG